MHWWCPGASNGETNGIGLGVLFFLFALTASTSCATLLALVLIRESFGVANDTLATSAQGGASAMTPPKKQEKRKEALRQRAKEKEKG